MRTMCLKILAFLLILLIPAGALATGETEIIRLTINDPSYSDSSGKLLDLTGLTMELTLRYDGREASPRTMTECILYVEESPIFTYRGYATDEYHVFLFNDSDTAYGGLLDEIDPLFDELLAASQALVEVIHPMQAEGFTLDPLRRLDAYASTLNPPIQWADQAQVMTDFFGESKEATRKTATVDSSFLSRILDAQYAALTSLFEDGEDLWSASASTPLTGTQIEVVQHAISDTEISLARSYTTREGGQSVDHIDTNAYRVLGDAAELSESLLSYQEGSTDHTSYDRFTLFVRQPNNAQGADYRATIDSYNPEHAPAMEASFSLTPGVFRDGWAYDMAISACMPNHYEPFFSTISDIASELSMNSAGNATDVLEGKTDLALSGRWSGVGGHCTFTGLYEQTTDSTAAPMRIVVPLEIELSPTLEDGSSIPSFEALSGTYTIVDEYTDAYAYELLATFSQAYSVIQELPGVRTYLNKTNRIADLIR